MQKLGALRLPHYTHNYQVCVTFAQNLDILNNSIYLYQR